jgi:hypothetical protein
MLLIVTIVVAIFHPESLKRNSSQTSTSTSSTTISPATLLFTLKFPEAIIAEDSKLGNVAVTNNGGEATDVVVIVNSDAVLTSSNEVSMCVSLSAAP